MDKDELIQIWKADEVELFKGWDFSYLKGRMLEEKEPWSYPQLAADLMTNAASVLDMGTGGGEKLLALSPHWAPRVVATEEYPPNLVLATERLAPLSIEVHEVKLDLNSPMPFKNGEFDLIINRHSGFNPVEIARVLSPGGIFLTQQVHGRWAFDLLEYFQATPKWAFASLEFAQNLFIDAGMKIITAQNWSGDITFTDVGAVVYYLKAVPWLVDGFSVDAHLDGLLALQEHLERQGKLRFWAGKYLLQAQTPLQ